MAKTTKSKEEASPVLGVEARVKALLVKKAHSIFEREPAPAFVGRSIDILVDEIVALFE